MALIKCPECGREISDKAGACPGCGCPIEVNSKSVSDALLCELNTGLGKILAYDKYIKIIPLNLSSIGRTERTIFYSNIGAISYRPTSLITQGYIQFVINGTVAKEVNVLKNQWEKDLAKDENTIMIKYSANKEFKKQCENFVAFLNSKI